MYYLSFLFFISIKIIMTELKFFLITLFPFVFLFVYHLYKLTQFNFSPITGNEKIIYDIVSKSISESLQNVLISIFKLFCLFLIFFLFINFLYDEPPIKFLFFLSSLLTSFLVGHYSLKFSVSFMPYFYEKFKNNSNLMSDLIKNNPYQHICVMIISFFIFEMLLIIGCLKIVFVADLFGLYSILQSTLTDLLGLDIPSKTFSNLSNMLILLTISGYFFGLIFHSFFCSFNIFFNCCFG